MIFVERAIVLTIYRRHYSPCKFAARKEPRRYRTCHCPIWVQGSLGREYVKQALDQRSWQAAADLVRGWEAAGRVGGQRVQVPTIAEAVEKFLADAEARNLRPASLKKYRRLLEGQFLAYCRTRSATALHRLTVDFIRGFRDSLHHSPVTRLKKLEILRAFLTFCQASEWIAGNPAKAVKLPRVERPQVRPFTPEEIEALLSACATFKGDGDRLRAIILLVRSTGLRIADAVSLTRDRVREGRLFLYTSKTGTPVWCPLPPDVVEVLASEQPGQKYFFWSGNGTLKSALESWRRRLVALADQAGVKDAHFHRFRHTFSVNLLQRGVPVETVATVLGNTPAIVSRHYSAFVESRQKALEEAVKAAWG
jgi:site-specific recombinase XerD